MARLAPLLTTADFARPELDALRLDGEVYPLGDCSAAIDQPPSAGLRAGALARVLPAALIAEQHTAAWVWGAIGMPPSPHEACADIGARARPSAGVPLRIREVVLATDDVMTIGGLRVTTPLRTAVDLARFAAEWSADEAAIVTFLMRVGDFGIVDCEAVMNGRRNLPNKRAALIRLRAAALSLPAESVIQN